MFRSPTYWPFTSSSFSQPGMVAASTTGSRSADHTSAIGALNTYSPLSFTVYLLDVQAAATGAWPAFATTVDCGWAESRQRKAERLPYRARPADSFLRRS